jgi:hypothetical protein
MILIDMIHAQLRRVSGVRTRLQHMQKISFLRKEIDRTLHAVFVLLRLKSVISQQAVTSTGQEERTSDQNQPERASY